MPHKEKIAWLSLIAMAVAFVPYFAIEALREPFGEAVPGLDHLRLFAVVTCVQVVILGAGHLYLRLKSPSDARMPADERDRAIMQRAITSAYYVLIAGMCLVGIVMPFNKSGWSIINSAIFMIIVSELVHYAVVVVSYRRYA